MARLRWVLATTLLPWALPAVATSEEVCQEGQPEASSSMLQRGTGPAKLHPIPQALDVPGAAAGQASSSGPEARWSSEVLAAAPGAHLLSTLSLAIEEQASRLFGAPALRLELHLKQNIKAIHTGPLGPFHVFLKRLQATICEDISAPLRRVQLVGVREPFFELFPPMPPPPIDTSHPVERGDKHEGPVHAMADGSGADLRTREHTAVNSTNNTVQNEFTIVDFEVLASGLAEEETPIQLARRFKKQLGNSSSLLHIGALGIALEGATIKISSGYEGEAQKSHAGERLVLRSAIFAGCAALLLRCA